MHDTTPLPEKIFAAVKAFQRTAALKAALTLDLFTAIGAGPADVAGLAARVGANPRGVRVLADYLTMLGLLEREGERWVLTAESAAYLDRRSPSFLADAIDSAYLSDFTLDAYARLAEAVRRGATALDARGTLAPEHPYWPDFARAHAPFGRKIGPVLARVLGVADAGPMKVLDIACGHGLYGISVARANRDVQLFAQDWPDVLAAARAHAAEAGVGVRFHELVGDALSSDLGSGYDLALVVNFLPDLDTDGCVWLLTRVRAALKPNGRVAVLQLVPNESRLGPPVALTLALELLVTTPAGDTYTYAELAEMFRRAGFARSERRELPDWQQCVLIGYA